eukprot:scaffold389122_cov26-Prasinocladus_malaysianus.AAC.2
MASLFVQSAKTVRECRGGHNAIQRYIPRQHKQEAQAGQSLPSPPLRPQVLPCGPLHHQPAEVMTNHTFYPPCGIYSHIGRSQNLISAKQE